MKPVILDIRSRQAFRAWLEENAETAPECWVQVRRGRPEAGGSCLWYLDAVEEALCFGWIDSTQKIIGGVQAQRFSPRKKNSPWSELNKERVRRLERLGRMTDWGRAVLPPMGPRSFRMDPDVEAALRGARVWSKFCSFPPLYRRIRAYNVAFYKQRNPALYEKSLRHLIEETKKGQMFGEWNDYGRLLEEEQQKEEFQMGISKALLQKYAELIVRTGANVQRGQVVQLTVSVEQHAFAALVMEECYKAGAKKVNVEWSSDTQRRLNFLYADQEVLAQVLPWEEAKMKQMVEDLPCRIYIASDDPDAMNGVDPHKLSEVSRSRSTVIKPYRNAIDGKHQWVIAAYPSVRWAKKCFPDLDDQAAVDRLWEAILKTVRVREDEDPVQAWKEHTDFIEKKAEWLNAQGFSSLRYKSANGTDFTVRLIPGAKWEGAGAVNSVNGAFYIPNMPTEEIFTSPMAGECEGTLVSVKPLSWNSQLIEDFSITFENGRAVSCRAAKGQELLEKMIAMDEGAAMLGEVALVPKESPVNQCGFLFYETLFDENACCHVALGMGFKEVLPDGDNLTQEQAKEQGVNDSIIHVDFMVGADDLNIDGIRPDGTVTPVFRNGTWAE